jgi:IS30 family transposase
MFIHDTKESSLHNFKYLFVIKDTYSHFVMLFPCASADSFAAAEGLLHWFSLFGAPEILISDQGSHFKNALIVELNRRTGSEYHFVTPYSPWANGSVERANKETVVIFQAILSETGLDMEQWPYLIPTVVDVMNSSIVASLGDLTPRELMTMLKPTNVVTSLLQPSWKKLIQVKIPTTKAYRSAFAKATEAFREMHSIALAATEKRRKQNRKTRQAYAYDINFDVGDFGLHADAYKLKKKHKLHVRWRGPYQVIKAVGPARLTPS